MFTVGMVIGGHCVHSWYGEIFLVSGGHCVHSWYGDRWTLCSQLVW